MVRVLQDVQQLSFLVLVAQKLQLKEKFISLKVGFFNVVRATREFLLCCTCLCITVLSVLLLKLSPCNRYLFIFSLRNVAENICFFNKNGTVPAPLEHRDLPKTKLKRQLRNFNLCHSALQWECSGITKARGSVKSKL